MRLGAGAYICGEETSLLESLEGKRGMVRAKPPLPGAQGPVRQADASSTTCSRFAAVPWILAHGAEAYADFGMGRSRGTLPIQLAGNIKHGGLIELAFGLTLRELIEDFGGGTRDGPAGPGRAGRRPARRLLPGPRCSTCRSTTRRSRPSKGLLGHGGIVVFDDTVDMAQQARFAMEFCAVGILRQVHALPHRRDARRRGDGPDHRRHRARRENLAVLRRPLRD